MSFRTLSALACALCLSLSVTAGADQLPVRQVGSGGTLHGAPAGRVAKSAVDTFLLMGPSGSGAPYTGDFEGDPGCDWHGWTSVDETPIRPNHWHVSSYRAVNGSFSAWCGDPAYRSCQETDPAGGYGNSWNEILEWRGSVDDPALPTTVDIDATANINTEHGYDFVYLTAKKAGGAAVDLAAWYGVLPGLAIAETVTYLPGEYGGEDADEIVIQFRFQSDGARSDEDCAWPTAGAIQLDDVTITSDNGAGTAGTVDFEDGTLGPFQLVRDDGVGDFARLWRNLPDLDPCATNRTCQVAFIDDGTAVPGVGPSYCQDWCYGPGGFVVNTTGGLLGLADHLHNSVVSPVMDWPDPDHSGGRLSFDVYRHQLLDPDAPGIFYTWAVRSSASGDPATIEVAPWEDRNFVYNGGPDYFRQDQIVDDLLDPGTTHVQIRLAVYELGWLWGWNGNNGTPAPYFDNVRLATYPADGPRMVAREVDLAQDAFPASGTIDLGDPGALSVRFDMAQNISPATEMSNDPGDSITFDCPVRGQDQVLVGFPRLHYRVLRNPLFAPYKTSTLPDAGSVAATEVIDPSGATILDRYWADLDDEGFLFPGDVVHYFLAATSRDTVGGGVVNAILPADTTGFSDFRWDPARYPEAFTMRCLPTLTGDPLDPQPRMLFWNDQGDRGGRDEWWRALVYLQLVPAVNFDIYCTLAPTAGVGNGLGGRATPSQIGGYETIVYTSGDLDEFTLGHGDHASDPSDDVGLLTQWLDGGDRDLFMTGDNIASDLATGGPASGNFLDDLMGLVLVGTDVRDLIGGQTAPLVLVVDSPFVYQTVASWRAHGGCPTLNAFDAVATSNAGRRLAVFADASGRDGGYPYSAMTLAEGVGSAGTSRVVSLPYDLMFVHTDPDEIIPTKVAARQPARERLLGDVLSYFGVDASLVELSDVPRAEAGLAVSHHPNPFNPLATITYTVPRSGRLTVKIYDLRGLLVNVILDEQVDFAGTVKWDGTDNQGAPVASGVYFYEVRLHDEVKVGKMALVR